VAERHHILIVDDETVSLDLLYRNFTEEYRVSTTTTGREALEIISQGDVDLIITDQRMPGMTGIELLTRVMKTHPHVVKIILTAYTDAGALLSAINSGCVYKFVTKPWEPQELKLIVKRALEHYDTARENARLYEELKRAYNNLKKDYSQLQKEVARRTLADRIVGTSPATQEVFSQIEKISGSNITVLIMGETGTGKELLAKTIHENSPRGKKKFIVQNCGSIPDTLLESELFGHKKGAFTGAIADKRGLLETSDGGTIFLDEIGETSPAMQIRLLRFLQEGEIRAVGSEETKKVDVRIISATNKDLLEETKKKAFRLDLYYRLSTYSIVMPPLRDRREDIPLLARYFLDEFNRKQLRLIKGFSQEVPPWRKTGAGSIPSISRII
jgi:two-component system response regulator HupR/HoxA